MLELQRPQSMSHAITTNDCQNYYSSASHPRRYPVSQPGAVTTSINYNHPQGVFHGSSSQAGSRSPPTPPLDMNAIHTVPIPSFVSNQPTIHKSTTPHTYVSGQSISLPPPSSAQSSVSSNNMAVHRRNHSVTSHGSPIPRRTSVTSQGSSHYRKHSTGDIAPSLQIPETIKTLQASMPQLAAEITCLFWFENSTLLNKVEASDSPYQPLKNLVPDAIPTTGFRKWVATILSTTQVAQNVILLALMFIYRLKKSNPSVKGKPGSEYRLLTVALMLGNKFLDDNTYTNKTWAEVSGISVLEVHIMEVEFLSNMRYSLFTSEEDWNEWHVTLGKFGTFFDKASRLQLESLSRSSLQMPPTTLPSPPQSTHASPPFLTTLSPGHIQNSTPTPLILPQVASTSISPIGALPEVDPPHNRRKRSRDETFPVQESPVKRQTRSSHHMGHGSNGNIANGLINGPVLPRLPNLSIPFSQPQMGGHVGTSTVTSLPGPLPPLGGNRAMSLVYPNSGSSWSQPTSAVSTATPTSMTGMSVVHGTPLHADQSRQLSPFPLGSANSSPINSSFSVVRTPTTSRLSPSYLLQQRQSPYRPVRSVNTLLHPPPSASMGNGLRHVPIDHIQYQPLSKAMNDRRAGHVPYMHYEAWPSTNQFNQWPVLPQPNFSRQ